ncbi:MAG: DUF115 domain-containing protein [Desulfovibrio sp.]|nr:MAG: DUF115 domain-containing protein [Desulfovibrio sp.]
MGSEAIEHRDVMQHAAIKDLEQAGMLLVAPYDEGHGLKLSSCENGDHVPSGHHSLWRYLSPKLMRPHADTKRRPLFEFYGPESDLVGLGKQTSLFVLFGAGLSSTLLKFLRNGATVLILEPDLDNLRCFVESTDPSLIQGKRLLILAGDMEKFKPQLEALAVKALFKAGFPVFLFHQANAETYQERFAGFIEYVELIYFRHKVYPVSGHDQIRGKPIRDIRRGIYFDQQKHLFENLARYVKQPGVDVLHNKFTGFPAVIVAAGPDLDKRLEWIASVRDRAVVICVNNALKPLLAAGVTPHVVVIVDSSVAVEASFEKIGPLEETILAAHTLSGTGAGVFPRICFWGGCLPEAFPPTPLLPWHGSVLTAAFSLAQFMGCNGYVFAGAQLAGDHPYSLTYAKQSMHGHRRDTAPDMELRHCHPQLYPVQAASGLTMYTTLNFLDTAVWLNMEIASVVSRAREKGEPVPLIANVTPDSLIDGPDVVVDEALELPEGPDPARAVAKIPKRRKGFRPDKARHFALSTIEQCRQWRKEIHAAQARPELDPETLALFARFEDNNVSYQVQRFEDFDNPLFYREFFQSQDSKVRNIALLNYFGYVERMLTLYISLLGKSVAALQGR